MSVILEVSHHPVVIRCKIRRVRVGDADTWHLSMAVAQAAQPTYPYKDMELSADLCSKRILEGRVKDVVV